MRFGVFASGALENYSFIKHTFPGGIGHIELYEVRAEGAGGGVWAQYDATWFAYGTRLAVTEFGGDELPPTYLEWSHNYHFYFAEWVIRPFAMPNASIGGAWGLRGHLGISGGARWNMRDSPFYATLSGGYKYVWGKDHEEGRWSTVNVSCYFVLWDAIALYTSAEAEKGYSIDGQPRWRARLDVGPSWAF